MARSVHNGFTLVIAVRDSVCTTDVFGAAGCREEHQAQAVALRWSGEQMEGARQALSAARSALQALKAVEKKRQQKVRPPAYCPSRSRKPPSVFYTLIKRGYLWQEIVLCMVPALEGNVDLWEGVMNVVDSCN